MLQDKEVVEDKFLLAFNMRCIEMEGRMERRLDAMKERVDVLSEKLTIFTNLKPRQMDDSKENVHLLTFDQSRLMFQCDVDGEIIWAIRQWRSQSGNFWFRGRKLYLDRKTWLNIDQDLMQSTWNNHYDKVTPIDVHGSRDLIDSLLSLGI